MNCEKIDGKEIGEEIGKKLKQENEKKERPAKLGVLIIGDDLPSKTFVNVKKKFGEKCGFLVEVNNLNDTIDFGIIKEKLIELQKRNDGVIVQLPLPDKLKNKTDELLNLIQKEKDVDCLNNGIFTSPIVLSLKKVLERINKNNFNNVSIVGLGKVVGIPIKKFFDESNIPVQVVGRGEYEKLKNSDLVISGVGSPFFIKKNFLMNGVVLIDYGCSFLEGVACGDFDPECFKICSYYTPVPGCMGPLVVASLFENVFFASKKRC